MPVEISGGSDLGNAADFWRTPAGNGALPDNVTDVTDTITHLGIVGIGENGGAFATTAPVAQLDVDGNGRSGVDGRVAGITPLYVTGNLPGIGGGVVPAATPAGGVEFRHSNQTQGIGFAFDGIYATGSNANQEFNIVNRGAGQFFFHHQALNGGINYTNYLSAALAANQGWNQRWWSSSVQQFGSLQRMSALALPGGGTSGNEWFFQKRTSAGTFRNALSLRNSLCTANASRIEVADNEVNDDKLVLFGTDSTTFFGFGIKASTLAYFTNATSGFHRFYAGPCPGTHLFTIDGNGNVTIDPTGVAGVGVTSPVLRFGSEGSFDFIKSQRTGVGTFLNALEFYTASVRRFAVLANGRIYMQNVPTFATDALAGAGGLTTGEVYKDVFGALRIKL